MSNTVENPGNYSTHALEQISGYLGQGIWSPRDENKIKLALLLLHKAQKFLIPPYGNFGELKGINLPDELWMPFPVCALEFHAPLFNNSPEEWQSSRRIVLVTEHTEKPHTLRTVHFWWMDQEKTWLMSSAGMEVCMIDVEDVEPGSPGHMINANQRALSVKATVLLDDIANQQVQNVHDIEYWKERIYRDHAEEIMAVGGFIETLSCHNVEHRVVVPEPVKLNKKRRKAGKPLFFEYHALVVNHKKTPKGLTRGPQPDRASPRGHLRRAHIRHYNHPRYTEMQGKAVLIPSCAVGSFGKGEVSKDYIII